MSTPTSRPLVRSLRLVYRRCRILLDRATPWPRSSGGPAPSSTRPGRRTPGFSSRRTRRGGRWRGARACGGHSRGGLVGRGLAIMRTTCGWWTTCGQVAGGGGGHATGRRWAASRASMARATGRPRGCARSARAPVGCPWWLCTIGPFRPPPTLTFGRF